jgi:hypothetical protein
MQTREPPLMLLIDLRHLGSIEMTASLAWSNNAAAERRKEQDEG